MSEPTQADEDARAARGAAAILSFALDMRVEALFRGTRGSAAESEARQVLLVVLRRALDTSSIQRLGAALGRERTTVAHALHKIEQACVADPDLDAFVDRMAELTRELIAIGAETLREINGRVAAARQAYEADADSPA